MTSSDKIRKFNAVRGTEARLLRRFELATVAPDQPNDQRLVIALASSKEDGSAPRIVLTFEGVRNLQFNTLGVPQLFLDIVDVSAKQWDGVIYSVREKSQEMLSFLCRDFSLSSSTTDE